MKPVRFSIPEAMLPYFLYAVWEVCGLQKAARALRTPKGYDIEYELSRENDARVRKIMVDAWKDRDKTDLSDSILY